MTAKGAERAMIAASFRRYIAEFDPQVDHLAFGSDWIMLGKEPGYEKYVIKVDAFLKADCGMSDADRTKVFSSNALRNLGLGKSDRARARLLEFYRKNRLDPPASLMLDAWELASLGLCGGGAQSGGAMQTALAAGQHA